MNRPMKWAFLVTLVLVFSCVGVRGRDGSEPPASFSKELNTNAAVAKPIAMAKAWAVRRKYELANWTILGDAGNTKWKELVEIDKAFGHVNLWEEKLGGRSYYAVYFQPKRLNRPGGFWLFIDKKTGRSLGILQDI